MSTSGSISYSNVAKLTTNRLPLSTITIYPNPLTGNILNVSMANVVAGLYKVNIFNALGEKVCEQSFSHLEESSTHTFSVNKSLSAGVYEISISDAANKQLIYNGKLSVKQ